MDVSQHITAGALPAFVRPDAGLLPVTATPHGAAVGNPTFDQLLQSQLQFSEDVAHASSDDIAASKQQDQAAQVARQLESLLLYNLLKEMWATVPEGTLLDTGMAGEFYREMWLEALADNISQTADGIGLADVLAADIARLSL